MLAKQDARAGGHHDGFRREEEREGVERLGAGPWRVAHTDPQHGSTHLTNTRTDTKAVDFISTC